LRRRSGRRTRAELAQLFPRPIELALRSEMRKDFVRPTQLTHRTFPITGLGESAR
jgi:hypothetical protein